MQTTPKKTQFQGWGIAILRVATGYLFLASGVAKLFIGDPFQPGSSLPVPIIAVGSLGELLCGVALIVGLLTRWVSIPLAILMVADIVVLHPPYDFFSHTRGFEYASLRLAACVALAITGSDKVALDTILALRRRPK